MTIRASGESGELRIAFKDFDQLDDFLPQAVPGGGAERKVTPRT